MVIEALQSYAQLASGLTKTTREKAMATAKGLLSQAGLGDVAADAGDRVSKLADELLATSRANRQLLTAFVDAEVKKAVGKLGLAKAEDIETLRAEIAALRAASAAAGSAPGSGAGSIAPDAAPVTRRPAKKAPARKAPAAKATAANVATSPAEAPAEPVKRPATKKASATTPTAKKATAKKATAKKTAAKKTAAEPLRAGDPAADTGAEGAS